MNLNPLATAALVMIGIAQVWQAQKSGDVEWAYVACTSEFTQNKKL